MTTQEEREAKGQEFYAASCAAREKYKAAKRTHEAAYAAEEAALREWDTVLEAWAKARAEGKAP